MHSAKIAVKSQELLQSHRFRIPSGRAESDTLREIMKFYKSQQRISMPNGTEKPAPSIKFMEAFFFTFNLSKVEGQNWRFWHNEKGRPCTTTHQAHLSLGRLGCQPPYLRLRVCYQNGPRH